MARLIDADKLRECYESIEYDLSKCVVPVTIVRQNIEDMPTVDAVEVVRCKDCKYGRRVLDQDDSFGLMCEKGNKNNYRFDWFCANAERK